MSKKYTPTEDAIQKMGGFLNGLLGQMGLKNDAALARALEVAPPVICKLRKGTLPLGAVLVIRIHELTGMSTQDIRADSGSTAGAMGAGATA